MFLISTSLKVSAQNNFNLFSQPQLKSDYKKSGASSRAQYRASNYTKTNKYTSARASNNSASFKWQAKSASSTYSNANYRNKKNYTEKLNDRINTKKRQIARARSQPSNRINIKHKPAHFENDNLAKNQSAYIDSKHLHKRYIAKNLADYTYDGTLPDAVVWHAPKINNFHYLNYENIYFKALKLAKTALANKDTNFKEALAHSERKLNFLGDKLLTNGRQAKEYHHENITKLEACLFNYMLARGAEPQPLFIKLKNNRKSLIGKVSKLQKLEDLLNSRNTLMVLTDSSCARNVANLFITKVSLR